MRCSSIALALALLGAPAGARADDPARRHVLEVSAGGGLSWISTEPERVDLRVGGQLSARVALDLVHARADVRGVMPDPSVPDRFSLRADGRLLFLALHDLTWRRTEGAELLRIYGGLGGDIDLPDGVGHLMLGAGVAALRLARDHAFSEAYGAYAGATLRLRFWEIRDELRVAVHGVTAPPALGPGFGVDQVFAGLRAGVTVENRLYVQALREGVASLGPELIVSFEELLEGPVLVATLGLAGTLGL